MMDPDRLLLENLPMVERTVAAICRERRMSAEEAEEFSSVVKLRLLENDYAILRGFHARSSLRTYIAAVVVNILRDYRVHQYGKWQASAEAKRLGADAVQLERLLYRERWNLDEVIPEMERRFPGISRARCEEIAARLPLRFPRRHVDIEDVELAHDPDVLVFERARKAKKVSDLVRRFLHSLSEEDRLLFTLHFEKEQSVPSIARFLDAEMQPLYRRLKTLFADLRKMLEANGISAADARALVGSDTAILDFDLSDREQPRPAVERGKS